MSIDKVVQSLELSDQPRLDSDCTKNRFKGQVAVVTGGCGGIGASIVARLVNDGAFVAVIDLNEEKGQSMVDLFGPEVVQFYKVDVGKRRNCFQVAQEINAHFGKINHLVNGVAYFGSKALDSDEEDWSKTMSVNVQSYAFMGQACFEYMKRISPAENCSILNVSSISAHQTQPKRWTYSASKGAINMLTKNMALDMSANYIRVNSISPSWTWTPEVAKVDPQGKRENVEKIAGEFHMLNRIGEMSEVAAAATFLCSQDARFITATDLKVDGGYGAMSAEGHGKKSVFAGTTY